jgi:type I restriction enzyme, S subunit
MNPDQLLKYFDRISEASDAISRLRRFILDLAVRGKLVAQDPNDEPATELLKRIQSKKEQLVKSGEIKREKALPPLEFDELPYEISKGWMWARIRQITSDRGQKVPNQDFTYIDVTAINKEAGHVAEAKIVTAADAPSRARKLVRTGDVLYSCVRPYLLNIAVIESDIYPEPIASTAFAVLNGFGLVQSRYLWIVLRSPFMVECVEAKMRGQAYPAINDSDFALLPFPLPPLAEQHHIVAKVDELMTLCDRLEAAKAEREKNRDRLVSVSLQRLNQPSDNEDIFRDNSQFIFDNLPRLTTRPAHIKQLRQMILNLAVRGRFCSKNEFDVEQTVVQELREIRQSVCLSLSEKSKVLAEFERLEKVWSQNENQPRYITTICACHFITKGTTPANNELLPRGDIPFLKVYNIVNNKIDFNYRPTFISRQVHEKVLTRSAVKPGDVIMNIVGPRLGRSLLLETNSPSGT